MKIGIISQARMTSTRLPGKVLKEVNEIPLLKHHADRVLQSGYPIYIATTINATDEPIVTFCKDENIPFYRGDENHVLSRYYECAKENELDVIIRVTSDCPLIDGVEIKRGIDYYLQQKNPYLYISNSLSKTIPRGFDFEVFSFKLLEMAFENADSLPEIEHVTPYLYLGKDPTIIKEAFAYKQKKNQYRVTLDTIEDWELIKVLIEDYQAETLAIDEIINVLDLHPELVAINAHIEQKKLGE